MRGRVPVSEEYPSPGLVTHERRTTQSPSCQKGINHLEPAVRGGICHLGCLHARQQEEEVETHAERTARLRKFAMSSAPGPKVGGLSKKEKKQLAGRQRQKLRKERKKQKREKAGTTKQGS
ncbi:hypothetical protein CYMTET_52865 [Cymbomonas tetramitiformis]|uniref:Uncharacterized protein n=1 Tax=Cymbomonas tetramitiformis TaxID=36881 RepID=A0AAE0BJJ3_9CHLO|nr:hypothetical protein CYMTET_52865 [Cymbomonas tetramitiformis]